jgi:hypothetical protein
MSRQSTRGASSDSSGLLLGNEIPTIVESQVVGSNGSGSEGCRAPTLAGHGCKYFPADRLLPIALQLRLGAAIKGRNSAAGESLHRPTQLLHAQEADFAGCWFSPAINVGDENGNPAFWMLRKTATDTWQLSLRRGGAVVAAYRAKTKSHRASSIKLKMVRANNKFTQWPATVTISE